MDPDNDMPPNSDLLKSLAEIYPANRLLVRQDDLKRYQRDLVSSQIVMPKAAVVPSEKQQVIDTVKLCNRLGVPFVARGAGSSLSGGALPVADGIVIHLKDLNNILRLDPRDRIAVVEPGVINLHVTRAVAEYGLHYAPDPSSQAFCTIGGNVAFNSGGVHCLKYGMTSNHVLGLEAVLANGEVVRMGGESLEGVGPDLPGMFVGSEGLFGVALEVTLRLIPQVEARNTVLAAYRSLAEAGDAVSSVVASGLLPGALEIMDPLAIRVTEEASHAGYPLDAGALVIVELEGETIEVREEFADLLRIIAKSGAYQTRTATDEEERAAVWKGRMTAFTAIRKVSANYIIQDGVVPRSRLGEALAEIEKLSRRYDIPVANVFHAGDGNLHPLILYEAEGCTADRDKAEALAGEITRRCIEMGGSITGEHGVGLEKREYLPEMFSADDMDLMHRLREAIDPKGIANPGKMLEVGSSRSPAQEVGGKVKAEACEPASVEEVREAVRDFSRILPIGAGTKPALSGPLPAWTALRTTNLRGMVAYDPAEYTFTARAGTPVADLAAELAQHRQYLPFDPPLEGAGATIGGAVASGVSGAGSYQYGGIRNFIIGADFVDGAGSLIRGGSKVVKNAAGFDLPKLMVGSLGGLGVLIELTFKVFPTQRAFATVQVTFDSIGAAVVALGTLATSPLDLHSVEILPDPNRTILSVRFGGPIRSLRSKADRVEALIGGGDMIEGEAENEYWRVFGEHSLSPVLVRVPITPSVIGRVDRVAVELNLARRYGIGGSVAWLSASVDESDLVSRIDLELHRLDLPGVVLKGRVDQPLIGPHTGVPFRSRVKSVLDPFGRFRPFLTD